MAYFRLMRFSGKCYGYENTNLHFVRETCEKSRPYKAELLVLIFQGATLFSNILSAD